MHITSHNVSQAETNLWIGSHKFADMKDRSFPFAESFTHLNVFGCSDIARGCFSFRFSIFHLYIIVKPKEILSFSHHMRAVPSWTLALLQKLYFTKSVIPHMKSYDHSGIHIFHTGNKIKQYKTPTVNIS